MHSNQRLGSEEKIHSPLAFDILDINGQKHTLQLKTEDRCFLMQTSVKTLHMVNGDVVVIVGAGTQVIAIRITSIGLTSIGSIQNLGIGKNT